jgi:hypothetical protein
MAGRPILQIWLALRAWGLRPSTPRLAGARVLAVSETSRGLRPHTPGPSAAADVSAAPQRMRTRRQASRPRPSVGHNRAGATTQSSDTIAWLARPRRPSSVGRITDALLERLYPPRAAETFWIGRGTAETSASAEGLPRRLHLPKARGCGGGAPDLPQRQRAHGPLPNAGWRGGAPRRAAPAKSAKYPAGYVLLINPVPNLPNNPAGLELLLSVVAKLLNKPARCDFLLRRM